MTKKELENKVNVCRTWGGGYKVTINFRGNEYTTHSNNSVAWDSLDDEPGNWMTRKQALQQFYNECKRKNNLS